MGVIKETGPDTYKRNGFSTSLGAKRYSDAYPCMYVPPAPLPFLPFTSLSDTPPTNPIPIPRPILILMYLFQQDRLHHIRLDLPPCSPQENRLRKPQ
jgi:hypothetical protein